MSDSVLELYPNTGRQRALRNLYMDQLAELPTAPDEPFIYSNFIASLDGRIALPAEHGNSHQVPAAIANDRDWRLFQELAAQADLLITSARYFRQATAAEAQAELPVGMSADFDDLRAWRLARGLPTQPDIAILSASLDIPTRALNHYADRRVFVITGEHADAARRRALTESAHIEILNCGAGQKVDASLLRERLRRQGYRRVYAIGGPSVLHTLVSGNALDRLYHTTAQCLLGGTEFDTIVWGEQLRPAFPLPLRALYLDRDSPAGCGQTMAVYGR